MPLDLPVDPRANVTLHVRQSGVVRNAGTAGKGDGSDEEKSQL
jgi:hypothetical protein